jgi:arginine decarboxylase
MSNSVIYSEIPILRAAADGRTELAAFHAALAQVGLAHYNLVRLSSVIPPGTGVDPTGKARAPAGAWGDRMYCVYASQSAKTPGEQAWAGVGWVQRVDGRGGLFVEHEGRDEEAVTALIRASLADMVAGAAEEYGPADWVVHGLTCVDLPVCALVIAPYEAAGWTGNRPRLI